MNLVQICILIACIGFIFTGASRIESALGVLVHLLLLFNCICWLFLTSSVSVYTSSYLLTSGKVDTVYNLVTNSNGTLAFTDDKKSINIVLNKEIVNINSIRGISDITDTSCVIRISGSDCVITDKSSVDLIKLLKADGKIDIKANIYMFFDEINDMLVNKSSTEV